MAKNSTTFGRRQRVLALLHENPGARVTEMAEILGVSEGTIRNDLNALAKAGQLERVRGGGVPTDDYPAHSPTFAARLRVQSEAKRRIARWAAELVDDGDTVLLDASTTVYRMAQSLDKCRNLTVITNGIEVARKLAQNTSNTVLLLGGLLRPDGIPVTDLLSENILKDLHIKTAFVSCAGFSPETGLTEVDIREAQLKSKMIASASSVVALIESSKFGKVGLTPFAQTSQVSHILTDSSLSPEWIERLQQMSMVLTVCDETTTSTHTPRKGTRHYLIGFANLTEKMTFAQQVRQSLEQAAAAQENVDLLVRDNNLDRKTALENAEWFARTGVDLVIEYQIDEEAGNVIMDRFRQSGIPVIAVDILLPGATFFGANNYRAGFIAGEGLGRWIQENWQGQIGLLVELHSLRVGATAAARLQGEREGLESVIGPIADDHVLRINSPVLVDEAEAQMAEQLPSLPTDVRIGIIAINDDAAVGALTAFEIAGRLDQVVAIGQNLDLVGRAALVRSGFPLVGSTCYRPECYGEQLLDIAVKLLNGSSVPPAIYCSHAFVTRQNLQEFYPDLFEERVVTG